MKDSEPVYCHLCKDRFCIVRDSVQGKQGRFIVSGSLTIPSDVNIENCEERILYIDSQTDNKSLGS